MPAVTGTRFVVAENPKCPESLRKQKKFENYDLSTGSVIVIRLSTDGEVITEGGSFSERQHQEMSVNKEKTFLD